MITLDPVFFRAFYFSTDGIVLSRYETEMLSLVNLSEINFFKRLTLYVVGNDIGLLSCSVDWGS